VSVSLVLGIALYGPIANITSPGSVSQFSEVPKKADRSRSKVAKENVAPSDGASSLRAGRGETPRRGTDSVRGGRGRGTERGRGAFAGSRGGRGGATNGPRATPTASVPTTEAAAWDTTPTTVSEPKENGQPAETAKDSSEGQSKVEHAAEAVKGAAKKTWASMFSAPKPAPAAPKPAEKAAPAHTEPPHVPEHTQAREVAHEPAVQAEHPPIPPVADEVQTPPVTAEDPSKITPIKVVEPAGPDPAITPSKDELTKENVEHLPDESHPPPTETAFSTVASSKDIGSAVATPLSSAAQLPIGRPGMGGYATSALKATSGGQVRSASFQRRLMEQQEAVVMPGNHAVDRAAVQFGSLGLGNTSDLDIDEEREDAETREQPPQHSPVTQPRAALPPAPRQPTQAAETQQEPLPTPKPAPGLPPAPQQQQSYSQQSPSNPLGGQSMQNQGSQSSQRYDQFGRYGQPGLQSEAAAPPQKPYDVFGQQIPSQSSQYDFPGQQSQAQSQSGAFSSAPDNYSSQYLTSEQRYQQYYGSYGQHGTPSQQEAGSAQQRTGSAFGSGPTDAAFSQSQQQVRQPFSDSPASFPFEDMSGSSLHRTAARQPVASEEMLSGSRLGSLGKKRPATEMGAHQSGRQSSNEYKQGHGRYNDTSNSGHNTPNPALGGQQPGAPGSQGQHMQQQHSGQQAHSAGYPYNHPYYGSPYYANYMNQFGGYGQGGAGYGSFGGKGMYGQPQHYGMSPQASYDQHSSSPANAGGFAASSSHERAGLGEYGRSASGTSQNHNATAGSGGLGSFQDSFGRQQGYSNQSSYGQQQGVQPGGHDESLKPFGDSKNGPSQSVLGAQQGRPGSATQSASGQGGPQQSHQQGFGGGYPSHLGGNSQYGGGSGLGGLGHQGANSHQQSQYGNYGGFSGGGGGGYGSGGGYNNNSRGGGWGGNYGHN